MTTAFSQAQADLPDEVHGAEGEQEERVLADEEPGCVEEPPPLVVGVAQKVFVGELFNLLVDLGSPVLAAGAYNTLMRRVRAELETLVGPARAGSEAEGPLA